MVTRLIQPADIPETLWRSGENCLHLAPDLVIAWEHLLKHAGLEDQALQPDPGGEIGGSSKKATDDHLAWRFNGSSARVQLGFLDPKAELDGVADAFAKLLSGGTVLVADLACGSGAATLTLLACIAELRRKNRIPRHPMRVKVVGGDLSQYARDYAGKAMDHIKNALLEQAIWVSAEYLPWDALDEISTSEMTNRMTLLGEKCSARLIIVANFSGFLQGQSKWKEASAQIKSLLLHARAENSFALWIEPQTNTVIGSGGFFSRVIQWFKTQFSELLTADQKNALTVENLGKSSSLVQHPLGNDFFNIRRVIHRFDLPLTREKK